MLNGLIENGGNEMDIKYSIELKNANFATRNELKDL